MLLGCNVEIENETSERVGGQSRTSREKCLCIASDLVVEISEVNLELEGRQRKYEVAARLPFSQSR